MTVTTTSNKVVYQGNNATTSFGFSFAYPGGLTPATAGQYLMVNYIDQNGNTFALVQGPASNNYQLQVNPAITPNPTSIGGSVVYAPGGNPIPTGSTLVITRVLPPTQQLSLANQGSLWQPVIEGALDFMTMFQQQFLASSNSPMAIVAPPTDPTGLNYMLPAVSARASNLLAFDGAGNVTTIPLQLPGGPQNPTGNWTFSGSTVFNGTLTANNTSTFSTITVNTNAAFNGPAIFEKATNFALGSTPVFNDAAVFNVPATFLYGTSLPLLEVRAGAGGRPVSATTLLHLSASGTVSAPEIDLDAYQNACGILTFRSSNGPPGTETATTAGTTLGLIRVMGFYGTTYTSPVAQINFSAQEGFASGSQGTDIEFYTTPKASGYSFTKAGQFWASGGFSVGPVIADPGAGWLSTYNGINCNTQLNANVVTTIGLNVQNTPYVANGVVNNAAGGSISNGILFSSTAHMGLFFGSGAPTIATAVQGSLYINVTATTTTTRFYIATGTGVWTNFTTAA